MVWRRSLWRYRLTAAGVLLAISGAATSLSTPPKAFSATAAAVGLVVAASEIRANRRRAANLEFQARESDDYRDVLRNIPDEVRTVRTAAEVGIVLTRQTAHMLKNDIKAELTTGDFTLSPGLKRYSFDFLARRARKGAMHNDPVLGLASDLPSSFSTGPVRFRRAMYFDFVCSNLLAQNDIYDASHNIPVLAGRQLITDRHGRLRPFAESRLANTVGISTLAFTRDGKLVLVRQTADNVGSPGLFAPSGSGALEPKDMVFDLTDLPLLRDVILNGAERELQEECNIGPGDIVSSDLTGHARWISRGAMPEFCAVTLLNIASDELLAQPVRRPERPFVKRVETVWLSAPDVWDMDAPLDMLPQKVRSHSSWPLALALSCLAERLREEDWTMREQLLAHVGPAAN